MKKRPMTAEEILAELRQDPMWVSQQAEAARREVVLGQQFARHEQPILAALTAIGYDVASLGDPKLSERFFHFRGRWLACSFHGFRSPIGEFRNQWCDYWRLCTSPLMDKH
jgi:hypothetical protein